MRVLIALLLAGLLRAQAPVAVHVDANARLGPFRPIYAFFGYDEPNYTYAPNGRKLLGELGRLAPVPVYIRTHNLLTSGDGTASLKWGSTNAYSEDAQGRPLYDWTILDRIFDTYRDAGVKPLVEIGFMPEALSSKPQPYRHKFPEGSIVAGWAYPPKDYEKWGELVYRWVRHAADRYGEAEVASWYWEVWNEPDILYWQGTPEQYYRIYDEAATAVKRALPAARVGGPHSTGPGNPRAAAFLRGFLEHCIRTGVPLDYIGFHAKGSPKMVDGHVEMGLEKQLRDIESGFEIVASFRQLRSKPVIIGESDPEGCAACSARTHPQNAYRNGPLYASYTAAVVKNTLDLARRHSIDIRGMVTWAFEFEDQPYFDGLRTLATNGVDKPVLNLFRMLGLMSGDRVEAKGAEGIDALAARTDRCVSVLVWNYSAADVPGPDALVRLAVAAVPAGRVLMRHYRIDGSHSNAYAVWHKMGRPQAPAAGQQAALERAGQLEMLTPPAWVTGPVQCEFNLPRQGVSLVEFSW